MLQTLHDKQNGQAGQPGRRNDLLDTTPPIAAHGSRSHQRDLPVATATAYGPAGRRRQVVALVERCPHCGHAHLHRGRHFSELAGSVRVSGCGHAYRLHVGVLHVSGGAA